MLFFFFFKQKTAYEIRPCDWSSDVCSSDLRLRRRAGAAARRAAAEALGAARRGGDAPLLPLRRPDWPAAVPRAGRSRARPARAADRLGELLAPLGLGR